MAQISTLDKSSQRTTSSQVFMNTSVYYALMHICLLLDRRAIKKSWLQVVRGLLTTALGEIWAPLHSKGLHFQGYLRPAVQ